MALLETPSGLARLTHLVRRLLRPGVDQPDVGLPCPDIEVAVIGDIHGRFDLLERLLGKIESKAPGAKMVFVGDYVDRGAASRAVLDRLRGLGAPAICLKGNHEAMLLEFLDHPLELGWRWLRNGGVETLESYGISLQAGPDEAELNQVSNTLRDCLSDGTESWLRSLPLYWRSGNLMVTHAGPDPKAPIDRQKDDSLLWGHSRFLRDRRSDGIWVAHGHWIRPRPIFGDGRISVDTGAWSSGRLTAAIISPNGSVNFLRS